MAHDLLKGKWDRVKDKLEARWSKLTDDDLKRVEGRRDELAGLLEQRYGLPEDEAAADSKAFFADVGVKVEPHVSTTGALVPGGRSTPTPGAKPAEAVTTTSATEADEPER